MKRDVDYMLNDGEVIIVDTFTGRLMPGRRYNNGLHQAIEAKENVSIQKESRTLATCYDATSARVKYSRRNSTAHWKPRPI